MDKLKGALSGGQNKPAQGGEQKEDYLDKAVDAGEKKFGVSQSRDTNEKITDKARDMFEKSTGKNIPDKVSN
ncbi:MAG: hypothetical protein Q9160_001190 [Pyrenula sp. 1 TL-2023]